MQGGVGSVSVCSISKDDIYVILCIVQTNDMIYICFIFVELIKFGRTHTITFLLVFPVMRRKNGLLTACK